MDTVCLPGSAMGEGLRTVDEPASGAPSFAMNGALSGVVGLCEGG